MQRLDGGAPGRSCRQNPGQSTAQSAPGVLDWPPAKQLSMVCSRRVGSPRERCCWAKTAGPGTNPRDISDSPKSMASPRGMGRKPWAWRSSQPASQRTPVAQPRALLPRDYLRRLRKASPVGPTRRLPGGSGRINPAPESVEYGLWPPGHGQVLDHRLSRNTSPVLKNGFFLCYSLGVEQHNLPSSLGWQKMKRTRTGSLPQAVPQAAAGHKVNPPER